MRPLVPAASACQIQPDFARGSADGALITIGIPCYNRPNLLAEALASVAAQREFTAFEVVVCEDGGQAETRRVVEQCGVANLRFFVNRPGLGAVCNWNRCIQVAASPWVTILHEDDLLYPWFLKTVAPRLRDAVVAVSVRCVQGTVPPELCAPAHPAVARPYAPLWFLKGSMTPFPGVVFSRAAALRLECFDAAKQGLADYDFWYRLACTGVVETLRQPAAFYRVNEGQWTERAWPDMLRRAHVLRQRIAREQLAGTPRLGRWIARFYTGRMALAYSRRFKERPATLVRAQRLRRIPFAGLPSGWVWALLQRLGRPAK